MKQNSLKIILVASALAISTLPLMLATSALAIDPYAPAPGDFLVSFFPVFPGVNIPRHCPSTVSGPYLGSCQSCYVRTDPGSPPCNHVVCYGCSADMGGFWARPPDANMLRDRHGQYCYPNGPVCNFHGDLRCGWC